MQQYEMCELTRKATNNQKMTRQMVLTGVNVRIDVSLPVKESMAIPAGKSS